MELPSTNCINCGLTVQSPYCAQCGQKNPPKKLTILTLYADFQSRVYGFDGMFPRTLKDLTLMPGKVAESYIEGNRMRYIGPVGYFFLALTMYLLVMELLGLDLFTLSKNNSFQFEASPNQEAYQKFFTGLISRYARIFFFLLIPINGLFALMIFRKEKFNFLEHSILVFLVTGHVYWFAILLLIIFKASGVNLNNLQMIFHLILYSVGCIGLYKGHTKTKAFLKGIVVSILSYLTYIIFLSAIALYYILSNPELRSIFKNTPPH